MKRLLQQQAKRLFLRSLQDFRGGFLEIVCPDATYTVGEPGSELSAMAVIHDERFFVRAVTGADIGIGESYMDGDWSSPDLVSLIRLVVRNLRRIDSGHKLVSAIRVFASRMRHRLRTNSLAGSRKNIRAHYDLGNEFYRLFLDEQMNYSCAFFENEDDSLETAQQRKLDMICKKLRIEAGDRVLEIGCGRGDFACWLASQRSDFVGDRMISALEAVCQQRLKHCFLNLSGRVWWQHCNDVETIIFQPTRASHDFVGVDAIGSVNQIHQRRVA